MRYLSNDGKVFENEYDCLEHEAIIQKKIEEERIERQKLESEKKKRYEEIQSKKEELYNLTDLYKKDYGEDSISEFGSSKDLLRFYENLGNIFLR